MRVIEVGYCIVTTRMRGLTAWSYTLRAAVALDARPTARGATGATLASRRGEGVREAAATLNRARTET